MLAVWYKGIWWLELQNQLHFSFWVKLWIPFSLFTLLSLFYMCINIAACTYCKDTMIYGF